MRYVLWFWLILLPSSPALGALDLHVLADARLTPPEVVERFAAEYGIRVRFEYFESTEALASYLETNARGDLILLRGHCLNRLINDGLAAPLNHDQLPNLENLSRRVRTNTADPECHYSVPLTMGTLGIIYQAGLWGSWPPSWDQVLGSGEATVPFAVVDHYRDALGAALMCLGYSFNSTSPIAIGRAADALGDLASHPAFMGFMDNGALLRFLREKIIYVAVTHNNVAAKAIAADPGLAFHVPRQGSASWSYAYLINSGSPNKHAAHAWLNYLMRPEVAAEVAVWNTMTTPNQAAYELLPPALKNSTALYPPETVWESAETPVSVGASRGIYLDYWHRVR